MLFAHKRQFGKDYYYPITENAKKLLEAFPHSNGKRKSLTLDQLHVLERLGLECRDKIPI